jgi:hypothetical protein
MPPKLTLSNLIIGVGALVAFIFSFLDFFKFGDQGINAWDGDGFAFASTVPAILALVALIWIGLELANVNLPDQVLTFTGPQLKATWGIAAFGIMLSWLSAGPSGTDKGIGFWLMFIGSLAMAVGAVMALLGVGNEALSAAPATTTTTDSSVTPPPPPPPVG